MAEENNPISGHASECEASSQSFLRGVDYILRAIYPGYSFVNANFISTIADANLHELLECASNRESHVVAHNAETA